MIQCLKSFENVHKESGYKFGALTHIENIFLNAQFSFEKKFGEKWSKKRKSAICFVTSNAKLYSNELLD